MRVLIDECIDPRVKTLFSGHDAHTVREMAWDRLKDGPLLELAARSFDVFVTIDRSLEYQQNFGKLALGLVVIEVPKNQMRYYLPLQQALPEAAANVQPGKIVHVGGSD